MKAILATAALLVSASALAHETETCDANIHGGVSINQHVIEFSQHKKPLYKIVDDEHLYVKGESIYLDADQQALVRQYSKDIKALVPAAKKVAIEGIDLAVDGVNLAFSELLGEGNNLSVDLTASLNEIRTEINENMSIEKGFYIDEHGIEGEGLLGKDFEDRIESVMEKAVKNSIGTILVALGQQMLFSGGDMEAFEAKMEGFGEHIEREMESKAAAIEKSANKLCGSLESVDLMENRLVQEIDALAGFNILTVDYNNHEKI